MLAYHDVLPPGFPKHNPLFGMTVSTTEFEWQLRYLQKHYNPITFQEFSDWFSGRARLPRYPVLITLDDGHRNNLDFAVPILTKLGISAVFFAVAGFPGSKQLTWFEDAYYRLMFSQGQAWRLNNGEVWPLTTKNERIAACGRFFCLCRSLTQNAQTSEIESLKQQLPTEAVNGSFPGRFEFLSSDHLRIISRSGFEIGAHTMSHPILATVSDERSQSEIAQSKAHLERSTNTTVCAFAYPFGSPELDFSERERENVRHAGYKFAFAGEGGRIIRSSDPLKLPRVGIGNMRRSYFAATVAGATASLKNLLSTAINQR